MKKSYLLFTLTAGALISLSFADLNSGGIENMKAYNAHKLNASGANPGLAGAPGDATCTQCHSGTAQDGSGINMLIVADANGPINGYTPGATYTVALAINGAGSKNGFQTIPLATSNNAMAGTVTAGTGNKVVNGSSGRKYVTHNSAGSASSAWSFTWTAPATNMGPIRFYLATNQANNNGQSTGDIIRLSQHDLGSFASTEELAKNKFEVGFAAETGILKIKLEANSAGAGYLNVVDLSGNSVYTEQLGKISSGDSELNVRMPESLKNGIYVIHLGVDNNFASKKVAIYR